MKPAINRIRSLCLAAAIAATALSARAASTPLTLTAAPANFPGDTFGATTQVNSKGPGTSSSFMDVEGSGNGTFSTFAVIDFTNVSPGYKVSAVDPSLTLELVDAPFSATKPGTLDFFLTTSTAALSTVAYQSGAANGGIGTQFGTLTPLGTGAYTSSSASPSGEGITYDYTLTLPDSASTSYVVSQLNGGATSNLRILIAADASTPNVVGSFAGSTNLAPFNSPTLTLGVTPSAAAVPAPPAAWMALVSLPLLALGLRFLRARRA